MVAELTCPSCRGSGYEAVAEDEVAPCTHPDHEIAVIASSIPDDSAAQAEWCRTHPLNREQKQALRAYLAAQLKRPRPRYWNY